MAVLIVASLAGCSANIEPLNRREVEVVSIDNSNAAFEFEDALARVAQVCMEGKGFDTHPPRLDVSKYDVDALLGSDVYTDPDVSEPIQDWYRMWFGVGVVGTYFSQDDDPRASYGRDIDEFALLPQGEQNDYFDALYRDDVSSGAPETETVSIPGLGQAERAAGGCQRMAEDAITDGDYVSYLTHTGRSGTKGFTGWRSDDRVVSARETWASCMVEAGYDFSEPVDIRFALSSEIVRIDESGDLSDEDAFASAEVELAAFVEPLGVADHACHERASLERTQADVYWEYQVKHVSAHQDEFFSFREQVDEYLATAQEIIERGTLQ